MSIAKGYTAHLVGLSIEIITVEVDISNGLNHVSIVGLGDRAVEEAKDRISAALKNSAYVSPKQKNQKVVISLAPGDVRKEGTAFDLAMALSYLVASGQLLADLDNILILGELSLEGNVRRVPGLLPILCQAKNFGFKKVFVPSENASEASIASGISIFPIQTLRDAISCLEDLDNVRPLQQKMHFQMQNPDKKVPDMSYIRGNESAKRGLEIAAAGGHNVLMFGPPGTGKTMLAQSFPSILPPLSYEECVEVTGIHSAARALDREIITAPPFRAPHHTASYPAVVGGGMVPRPGELTLAHRGVLFLDELPEFDRAVLEALRQPLEERTITIARARGSVTFPAQCILIASMNPCPCGKPADNGCICTPGIKNAYRRKISGPIMDRLDLWINVNKVDYRKMSAQYSDSEPSASILERIIAARKIQRRRFELFGINKSCNSELSADDLPKICLMDEAARQKLLNASEKLSLSGRSIHRIMKIARTIADLSRAEIIQEKEVLEALQFRHKLEDL